ncbi:hypothetical protein V9T40_000096 [Parthenolecanium corni]|uniref:Enkurin domain-containing protein n=1 Tax=Parthenolecanium corni TaxID=536013 RepID=A0AAN9Y3Z9_9HEMI
MFTRCTANPDDPTNSSLKSSHQISHENEEEKKDTESKKLQNPTSYKKGEVPRYLKERNAQLERDRQERETREKLEELLGFKDPKCPPGHMLMPPDELQHNLSDMETKFNALVAELNRMPVSNDSYKIRQRSIQIEKELRELEGKIELYKTKRVFVKIPEPQ